MLSEKVIAEFESIRLTDFWNLFVKELEDRKQRASRDCETQDDPRKAQGAAFELNFILGKNEQKPLWERLLLKLQEKEQPMEVKR